MPGAGGYDLSGFWSPTAIDAEFHVQTDRGEPALEARIAAPALSRTPAGDACLDEAAS